MWDKGGSDESDEPVFADQFMSLEQWHRIAITVAGSEHALAAQTRQSLPYRTWADAELRGKSRHIDRFACCPSARSDSLADEMRHMFMRAAWISGLCHQSAVWFGCVERTA
jgi:predicted transcriptional regulator